MVDLHIHSKYSDGSNTVEELLEICEEKKLKYISITDHNTCEAYFDNIFNSTNIFSGKIIIGCEFNAEFKNRAIEILGYNINPKMVMAWRKKYYSNEKTIETTKMVKENFLKALDDNGIIYNLNDIRPQKDIKEFIERPIYEEIIKHLENKEIIGEENFNSIRTFFRNEITNPNSKFFLNRVSAFPKAKDVVNFIHQMGGIAFLAHPYEYKFDNTIEVIDELNNEVKLDGIECFHPSSEVDNRIANLIEYVQKNNMLISGGSDYHGNLKPDIQVGIGRGKLNISENIIKDWI